MAMRYITGIGALLLLGACASAPFEPPALDAMGLTTERPGTDNGVHMEFIGARASEHWFVLDFQVSTRDDSVADVELLKAADHVAEYLLRGTPPLTVTDASGTAVALVVVRDPRLPHTTRFRTVNLRHVAPKSEIALLGDTRIVASLARYEPVPALDRGDVRIDIEASRLRAGDEHEVIVDQHATIPLVKD